MPTSNYSSSSISIDDKLTVIAADILAVLMENDSEVVKEIIAAYATDSLATNILEHSEEYPNYRLVGQLIYRLKKDGGKALYIPRTATISNQDKLTVNMREQLCFECHDSHVAGHIGVNRMSALLKRSFFWPKMDITIKCSAGSGMLGLSAE